jgi:multidrug efflux pump subunit AcrA (membrane-fusion protein)
MSNADIAGKPRGTPGRLSAEDAADLRRIRGPARLGLVVVLLFLGLAFGWGGFVPLDSAAVAPGFVSIDTNRKTIQHLEGGIVREILVRDGDRVAAGQVLIRLEETAPRAKIEQLEAQIAGDSGQLKLVKDEERTVNDLYKKGYAQLPRLLQLQRRRVELEGQISQSQAALQAARDALARTVIKAPMAGTVVELRVHTRGGVLAPGAAVLDIVPADEPLVIEARIEPNDIDVVHANLPANIRLTPYNFRTTMLVKGTVAWVSADRITDPKTNQVYYSARIKIDPEANKEVKLPALYPGMPVEVMIVTGQRTALSYLTAPLTASFNRAFRQE